MDQALIKTLLESSLHLRLALLDAEPEGAGWFINKWGRDVFKTAGDSIESVTDAIDDGTGAWLPCNPLAIVEHAARLRFEGGSMWCGITRQPDGNYCASMTGPIQRYVVEEPNKWHKAIKRVGACPHTAAVALLREVLSC